MSESSLLLMQDQVQRLFIRIILWSLDLALLGNPFTIILYTLSMATTMDDHIKLLTLS